jgi:hypothetical protein
MSSKLPVSLRLCAALFAISSACSPSLPPGVPANDARPPLFNKLDGNWIATGQVEGESVTYAISVSPALGCTFSQLHMLHTGTPPAYEALVFLGTDSTKTKVFAHWLDTFGGAFSVPHGEGFISGDTIAFTIPYSHILFLDRFVYHPGDDSWTLDIDAKADGVERKNFASYRLVRTNRFP